MFIGFPVVGGCCVFVLCVLADCFDFGAFLVGLNGLVVFGLNVRQTQKHFVTTFNFNYL